MRRSRIPHSPFLKDTPGFSLIEVVIAIAIIAVALVGLLGLFPVAIDAATNSQRETQSALIARQIYTDLDARSDTKRLLIVSTNSVSSDEADLKAEEVDLTKPSTVSLAYSSDGQPLGKISDGDFNSGKKDAGFLAQVKVIPQKAVPNGTNSTVLDMSRIEVTVQAPGVAAEKTRKKYNFVSIFRQGAPLSKTQPPSP